MPSKERIGQRISDLNGGVLGGLPGDLSARSSLFKGPVANHSFSLVDSRLEGRRGEFGAAEAHGTLSDNYPKTGTFF